MTATATTSSNARSLSRLARLGAGLGFRQPSQHTEADEWYIPYNGPYEQPKDGRHTGKGKDRDSGWNGLVAGGELDPFGCDPSALLYGGFASASGHGHGSSAHGHTQESFYDEERGRTRSRAFSASSNYSESVATLGGGGGGGTDRRSHALVSPTASPISPRAHAIPVRGPVPSFLNLDTSGIGIGESPVPKQRVNHHPHGRASGSGHGHEQAERTQHGDPPPSAVSPRDSLASFWTFGRARKSPPLNVPSLHSGGGRPSVETHQSRPSTSTRQTVAQGGTAIRDRSATIGGRSQEGGDAPSVRLVRPRANTAVPPAQSASTPALIPSRSYQQRPNVHSAAVPVDIERTTSPYQQHPYSLAFPPAGHREHSRIVQPSPKRDSRSPVLNLTVPFLSYSKSFASLKRSSSRLKASVSTPNLREPPHEHAHDRTKGSGGGSSGNTPNTPNTASSRWLSAETWCDALLFPRPRFRVRTAHVISPPESPAQNALPQFMPTQTRSLKRSLLSKKSALESRKEVQAPSAASVILSPTSLPPPAQSETGTYKKPLRPPRPKSFAQDDLALPSPVPSLATVLKQSDAFEKERTIWKQQATRSFQNKRSRSLSQSRMKTKAKLAAKMAEDESELATSFDLIAVTAFHGNQTLKPTVSFANTSAGSKSVGTNSTGLNTTSTHSRNTSSVSHGGTSRGHARKESWGKTALKTAKSTANTTGLCAFNEDPSPIDERVLALDNALERDQTKFVRPELHEERRDMGEGGVVLIAPHMTSQLSVRQPHAAALSPVPSNQSGDSTSHSGVGIALSTPTVLVDEPFQFTDHPYASGSQLFHRRDGISRAFEYAGPHPTRLAEYTLNDSAVNDVSMRHRMPAAATRLYTASPPLHPYAAAEPHSRPTLRALTSGVPPPASMFAQVSSGVVREVLPEEIQYSPYSAYHPGSSNRNSDALGVEEALSVAFSHGSLDDNQVDEQVEEREDTGRSDAQIVVAPSMGRATAYLPMPQIDEMSGRDSWQTSQDEDSNGNLSVPKQPTPMSFKTNSSPGLSLDSSPLTSPRQFKKFDDMEDYSDLFYRPAQQQNTADLNWSVTSHEFPKGEASGSAERPIAASLQRSSSGSALTNLHRQLSLQYSSRLDDERHVLEGDEGQSRHAEDLVEANEDIDDARATLSQGCSPPGATLPLSMSMSRPLSEGPSHLIPEDIESSRASSILERFETEEGTEVFYRVGEVPALATPDPIRTTDAHRASAHGSYFDDAPRTEEKGRFASPHDERNPRPSHLSLVPLTSATETTRASYMTSTSSASRISQLSDFPAPPSQNAMTRGMIIQSYFSSTPEATDSKTPLAESAEQQERKSRRTTFGGIEEIPVFD